MVTPAVVVVVVVRPWPLRARGRPRPRRAAASAGWPTSGGFTPKPSSPDQATRPSYSALPDGEVARTQADVWAATLSRSLQSSQGICCGRPSSPTTSSAFV